MFDHCYQVKITFKYFMIKKYERIIIQYNWTAQYNILFFWKHRLLDYLGMLTTLITIKTRIYDKNIEHSSLIYFVFKTFLRSWMQWMQSKLTLTYTNIFENKFAKWSNWMDALYISYILVILVFGFKQINQLSGYISKIPIILITYFDLSTNYWLRHINR